jgi:hypothetical protein
LKLSLRSIGGFAGPAGAIARTVDLDALPEDRRRQAYQLVEAAHVFDCPAKIMLKSPQSWDFRHVLDVDDGARSHRIELHLDAADKPLRELVTWLEDEGKTA